MSHTHLKLDTCKLHSDATPVVNYFIFQCLVTSTMKLLIEALVHRFNLFHAKTFSPCALRSMMKNCRVRGYFFWSRSLCRVTIYHGMKDVRIIWMKEEGWMPTYSSRCWSTRKERDRNGPLRLLSYPSKSFYPPCNSFQIMCYIDFLRNWSKLD